MEFKTYKRDDPKWELVKDHMFCTDIPNPFLQVLYLYKDKIRDIAGLNYVIETGTYLGHSAVMFSDSFLFVYTVEKEKTVLTCFNEPVDLVSRYESLQSDYPTIIFNFSDSESFLRRILVGHPYTRFVFLLDAHTIHYAPIIEELKAIVECSKCNEHVLIIDDTVDINDKTRGWPSQIEFESAIRSINKDYNIDYTEYGNRIVIVYE